MFNRSFSAQAWLYFLAFVVSLLMVREAICAELKVGDVAPNFTTLSHESKAFELHDRRSHGWTVLFFYPKAGTPGCTKQACAFRDNIATLRSLRTEVFGLSTDTVQQQAEFHKDQKLTFTLLADPSGQVADKYGVRIPVVGVARRWTFIVDQDMRIRWIDKNVDPQKDPQRVIEELKKLQSTK